MNRITFAVITILTAAPASAAVWSFQADFVDDDNANPVTLVGNFAEDGGVIHDYHIGTQFSTSADCGGHPAGSCTTVLMLSPTNLLFGFGGGSSYQELIVFLTAPLTQGGTIALELATAPAVRGTFWIPHDTEMHFWPVGWLHAVSGSVTMTAVPEPSALIMFAALLTLAGLRTAHRQCRTKSLSPSR